jgi:hypothetical protein
MALTYDDLLQIASREENQQVDFKVEISESVLRGLSSDVAAFANSQGGMIVFGVDDTKQLVGCLVKDTHWNRISQEASLCTPPVEVDIEPVDYQNKHFLAVKIPMSKTVHNDRDKRIPVRIGNVRINLDIAGIVQLLRQRGLTNGNIPASAPQFSERERVLIPDGDASSLARGLRSKVSSVRLEALKDLSILSIKYILYENPEIRDLMKDFLTYGTDGEKNKVLEALRVVMNWGTDAEKEGVIPLLNIVVDIAMSAKDASLGREAFNIVMSGRDERATTILSTWVKDSEESYYTGLQLTSYLNNAGYYGLVRAIRDSMYSLLEAHDDERTRRRVSAILDSIRAFY